MLPRLPVSIVVLCLCGFARGEAIASGPLGADALGLEDVVALAVSGRADLAAANARAAAYAQRPAIVGALEDPMVSPSVDHYPFDMPGSDDEMSAGDERRYDWSVSVEQRFPLSNVRKHRRDAARADARRMSALADNATLDVVLDAERSFFMLLERRRMKSVLEEQAALAQQLIAAASARYASGRGSQADVLRAEVESSRVHAAQQALAAETRAAEAMLNGSLGRRPGEHVPPLVYVADLDAPLAAPAAIERALLVRPELLAGEAEVERARAEIEVMRSMYKPMATLRVGRASTMAEGPGAMVMIGVSVPLWRERLRAGVAEARAMQRMADSDLAAMRVMVEAETTAAREEVEAARIRHLALEREVLPRAQSATEAALASYSSGQGALISVVETARSLWDVQEERVMSESALGAAWSRLNRAMGARTGQERR